MEISSDHEGVSRRLILLGPQPHYQSLRNALARLQVNDPIGLITAGWEEAELESADLEAAMDRETINARLFHRSEKLFADDPELIDGLRDRQDQLRELRDIYRLRLDALLTTARKLFRMNSVIDIHPEREQVIQQLRQLDTQYYQRTAEVCETYDQQLAIDQRACVVEQREQVSAQLRDVGAILISGGQAAIILNRLKIFGILDLFPELPIVAWSGGAMALADQIVFFHDFPPHGRGNPEILRPGMGLFDHWILLPNGRHRLRLDDEIRTSLFAHRFGPRTCVVLDESSILDRVDGAWQVAAETDQLSLAGGLEALSA